MRPFLCSRLACGRLPDYLQVLQFGKITEYILICEEHKKTLPFTNSIYETKINHNLYQKERGGEVRKR